MSVARAALAATSLLAACAGGNGSSCGPSSATVARVVDGDTVELDSGETVRYLLVDTPESTTTTECYGPEASQFNKDLVEGKPVELAYDTECQDRYGRLLAYVTVSGREVNTLLVERGYGCVLYIPPDGTARKDEFDALEAQAKADKRGLWAACDPIPCG